MVDVRCLSIAAVLALRPLSALAAPEPELPELFAVTGVAAGDVLNIREEPDASAEAIGSLPPDARGVEVVGRQGDWLEVNAGERSGWVNGRFMAVQGDSWGRDAPPLPPTLSCYGTEPFWSLDQQDGALILDEAAYGKARFQVQQIIYAMYPPVARTALAPGLVAAIEPESCSDGMSDLEHALSVLLIVGDAPNARQLNGCCSLRP